MQSYEPPACLPGGISDTLVRHRNYSVSQRLGSEDKSSMRSVARALFEVIRCIITKALLAAYPHGKGHCFVSIPPIPKYI
ncbi:MAG: hypothetical protein Q4A61_03185 [Porphyromonadaceae bacterium]|nr:hypothetical protein [Porphyromonadaceae bacterium]